MVTSEIVGSVIRELRERLGETQEVFCARLGVAQHTVSRYESGDPNHNPKTPIIKQLAALAHQNGFTKIELILRSVLKDRAERWDRTKLESLRSSLDLLGVSLERLNMHTPEDSRNRAALTELARLYDAMTKTAAGMREE